MPIQVINTGVFPNDGTGDPIRTAYTKINQNFSQFAPVAFTGRYDSLYGTPSFARVAYTGRYTDLLGTPVLGLLAFLNTINDSNWFGLPLKISHGGTGQVTASAAFDALSPMTAWGDMIFGKQYGAGFRLPVGGDGQVLAVSNGTPTWTNPTVPVINQITNITEQLPAVSLPGEGAYVHFGVASGTNVLSTTVTPSITSYVDGIFVELLCSNYNTGNVTLNNAGIGPAPVRWPDGTELEAHTLIPGGVVYLTYVQGVWQLVASGGGFGAGRVFNIQVLTSSGTYTPTSGAHYALVFATGGGGGGGAGNITTTYCGSGGGAGGTAITLVNLSGISSIPYTIGAGGGISYEVSGATAAGNGGNGGTTSFGDYASATGGYGGAGNDTWGYYAAFLASQIVQRGGIGTVGSFLLSGNPGVCTSGIYGVGAGGGSFWGCGGVFGQGYGTPPGAIYGGGGGGGDGQNNPYGSGTTYPLAAPGGPGVIFVMEF